jgi:hypothetical protein
MVVACAGGDAERVVLRAVFFAVGGERKDDPIVERGAEGGAFLLADADHLAGNIAPADFFSDRVHAGQQVFDEVIADDANRGGLLEVRFGYVAAGDEVDVVELGHLGRPGAEVGVFQRIQAALDLQTAAEGGADFLAGFAELADGLIVVVGDALALLKFEVVVDIGDDGGCFGYAKDIRAEAEDPGGDVLVGAVD